jgi:hypothetical protein
VFSGDRCVHEELVQGKAGADVRAQELRRVVIRRSHLERADGARGKPA